MENEKLKQLLMKRFEEEPDNEFTVKELVEYLHMTSTGQFKFVVKALAELEHDKLLTLNQSGAFTLARSKQFQTTGALAL